MTTTSAPGTPRTPYDRIGGEAGVRALTQRFYALMDELPEAAACRAIHPPSLAESQQKLFEFLTGWLGGPPLFTTRRGPPMLRARHLHAPIGKEEIEGWLLCFTTAWTETVEDDVLTAAIMPKVEALAWHMGNRQDPSGSTIPPVGHP
ncbi:group II truncated hemoglobin [Alsobacter sp. R-9]